MSKGKKYKVLITSPIICQDAIDMLEKIADVKIIDANSSEEIVINSSKDVDAILARTVKITKKVIDSAKNLKIISRHGVGVDGVDIESATKKGIYVTITPEANAEAVSEFAIALMMTFNRKIIDCFETVKSGSWERGRLIQSELFNKKLGIVGLGNIGSRVAKKAKAFDMQIYGYDPYISPERAAKIGVQLLKFEELLTESDIVTVHIPANPDTKYLFDKVQFDLMKKSALFVNTSRGDIVNEKALINALKNKGIAGACLDVFSSEPIKGDNELLFLDNVILSPHVAAQSKEALERVGKEAAQNIIKMLNGDIPKGVYNKELVSNNN